MKVRSKKQYQKATTIFTDREEPRKVFWNKYYLFKDSLDEGNIQVLSYYGIGGIGKSSLLKKLMHEMDEKLYQPKYIYFDLKNMQECHEVLYALKNNLSEKYKYSFPLFELGLYVYKRRIGMNPEELEVKQLTDKSPLLSLCLDVLGKVPVVSIATEVFSLVDQSLSYALTYVKQHKRELMDIEYMETDKLYQYLPYLFAQDLSETLQAKEEGLVVFLDTYECLVNEISSIGEPLLKDIWIRGEDGLIQNTSNVLWVIAGREKLKWEHFDMAWSGALEQHNLGSLSCNDSLWFLEQSGIHDNHLRNELYKLTNGVPAYLDVCVGRYRNLIENEAQPTIHDFGNNEIELVERFVRYMSDSQKDLIYMLAYLEDWTDEWIVEMAPNILSSFSIIGYEKCKEMSFISESNDGFYQFHSVISDVLLESCPKIIKDKVANSALKYHQARLEDESLTISERLVSLKHAVKYASHVYNEEDFLQMLDDKYLKLLSDYLRFGYAGLIESIFERLFVYAYKNANEEILATIYRGYADYLNFVGEYEKSVEYARKSVVIFEKIYGEDSMEMAETLLTLAIMLDDMTRYQEADDCFKKIFSIMAIYNGEHEFNHLRVMIPFANHLHLSGKYQEAKKVYMSLVENIDDLSIDDAIVVFMNYANVCEDLEEYEEATMVSEECFSMCLQHYGEDHAVMLTAAELLSACYFKLDKKEEAIELLQIVYNKRVKLFGDMHLQTLLTLNNLALDYLMIGKAEEALHILEEAISTAKDIYPEQHRIIISLTGNLASAYFINRRFEEAFVLENRVIETRQKYLGEEHPDTIESLKILNIMHEIYEEEMSKLS